MSLFDQLKHVAVCTAAFIVAGICYSIKSSSDYKSKLIQLFTLTVGLSFVGLLALYAHHGFHYIRNLLLCRNSQPYLSRELLATFKDAQEPRVRCQYSLSEKHLRYTFQRNVCSNI